MRASSEASLALGRRVIVVGPSCSGKTTLAAELARRIGCPFVELDALFWKPGWTPPPDDEFRENLVAAHSGEAWVSAGNYLRHTRHLTWPLADTIIWLDFPLRITTPLKLWSPNDSLIAYNASQHRKHRATFEQAMVEAEAAGKRFLRLRSPRAVRHWLARLDHAPRAIAP